MLADPQGPKSELFEFRMQAADPTEEDIEMEELDTPEVSFGKHVRNKRVDVGIRIVEDMSKKLINTVTSSISSLSNEGLTHSGR